MNAYLLEGIGSLCGEFERVNKCRISFAGRFIVVANDDGKIKFMKVHCACHFAFSREWYNYFLCSRWPSKDKLGVSESNPWTHDGVHSMYVNKLLVPFFLISVQGGQMFVFTPLDCRYVALHSSHIDSMNFMLHKTKFPIENKLPIV